MATIGTFDGVHLGHQALLKKAQELAAKYNMPLRLYVFEPHPQEFFQPRQAPARLTSFREKLACLQGLDIAEVVCLHFNKRLANMSAESFINSILNYQGLLKYLVIGDDFRFGQARTGDFNLLQTCSKQLGYGLQQLKTISIAGERVSSTRIRQALKQADFPLARRLLGRHYFLQGKVIRGQQRGRTIGVPTANLCMQDRQLALHGVYLVCVPDIGFGIANLGMRPTVDGQHCYLEVHLFDVNIDLYGRTLSVEFLKKLRDEQRFDSFEQLKEQIYFDIEQAKQLANRYKEAV